jgi:hypothetical protein
LATWVLLSTILLLACNGAAHAQTSNKFQSKPDGFEVDAPGKVEVTSDKVDQNLVRSTEYSVDVTGLSAVVSATLAKVDFDLAGAVKGSFPNFKCKTTTSDQKVPISGGQGRELHGDGCVEQSSVVARYYTVGKWLYQVIAIYKPEKQADAAHFVESFKLLDQGVK